MIIWIILAELSDRVVGLAGFAGLFESVA